jgi:hypothetical protein
MKAGEKAAKPATVRVRSRSSSKKRVLEKATAGVTSSHSVTPIVVSSFPVRPVKAPGRLSKPPSISKAKPISPGSAISVPSVKPKRSVEAVSARAGAQRREAARAATRRFFMEASLRRFGFLVALASQ